ncbi:MAG: hypothetical protein LLG05_14225 [Porphyromonadaceae bacterium]|nr:hypothetical protein [Porphyromonadaceae bacterium]
MRDKYYSDDRDLLKWATLVHIASVNNLRTILQVPYWRPEINLPRFDCMGEKVTVSNQVWKFFRNVHNVTSLGREIGVSVAVISKEFDANHRQSYICEVKTTVEQVEHPLALFLDPDTGLQPKKCHPEHTAITDIQQLWPALEARDWLVLYQHARHTHTWRESVADQLSSLCGVKATVVRSDDVGKDVVFICAQKEGKA